VTEAADRPAGGRLYVVATPIGNLADVTLRAIEVLGSVSLIAAEDTRMSRRLLDRHGIATRTTSYHARSGSARERQLLEALRAGADVALVTDAGTPGISDPGESLVAAWAAEGGTVVPIPGASAALAAIAGSGIAGPRWSFEGFLPRSGRERRDRLARIAADPRGTVLYEAPGRVAATLADLATVCGGERPAAICRELTKLHEEVRRGDLATLAHDYAQDSAETRGEFTIVIEPPDAEADRPDADEVDAMLRRALRHASVKDAVSDVAAATGRPRREIYQRALALGEDSDGAAQ
jgi:16S rRNA (cytidine1402-2'-O)-methyltransferase